MIFTNHLKNVILLLNLSVYDNLSCLHDKIHAVHTRSLLAQMLCKYYLKQPHTTLSWT